MDKKKLIMAVILFAALIFAGIILPLILKKEARPSKEPEKEEIRREKANTPSAESPDSVFQNFEDLKDFMAGTKIEELQTLFPEYLQTAGNQTITHITFLSEQSTYPSTSEVKLVFQLSDETDLVVYCDRTGRFLFGEEKLLLSEDTATYEKVTDQKLPDVSTSEVEEQQEGGFPDTTTAPKTTEKED